MIDRINSGDRDALKQLLTRYTKPIYERALARTKDDARAKEITRDTLSSIVAAAEKGECPADTSAWIMSLVDTRCSDDELSAILDDVLSKDPVGWERQEPKKDWQTEAPQAAWSGESKVQPTPAQEPQPEPEPEPEPRKEAETRSIQPPAPAYSEPKPRPEVRHQPQEPQKAAPDRARNDIPEEAPARVRSSRAVPELFDDGEDDEPRGGKRRRSGGVGMVLLILLLLVLVAALVWMLVVMLMTRGVLPMADFGFADWFNTNIFKLY